MGVSVNAGSRIANFSDDELASVRRMQRHQAIGLKALCIPFALSGIILANGNYLSGVININPNSILFELWPFNRVYLQQFANFPYEQFAKLPYDSSEIKWFFTVVSCSNVIWLIFLCWKLVFEVSRRDVTFPPGRSPAITQFIAGFFIVGCVILVFCTPAGVLGFSPQGNSLFAISIKQPITVAGFKVVMMVMSFLYVGAAIVLEFVGLGLRYLLSKRFGYFTANTTIKGQS